MLYFLKKIYTDESGAVTVDWVVLTAALVGLAIAVTTTLSEETARLAGAATNVIQAQDSVYELPE